ncbi:MAG TPA: ubiquinol oxidase subunit II [Candidatus Saccharimonadales bacterium]|nr:ubiquinol oxidase subunit II [Candidatus Saccharimonadales bacterium]
MRIKRKILLTLLLVFLLLAILAVYLHSQNVAVMSPAGQIANQERNLIFICLALSAIVVVPVFVLTIYISVKYRETNRKAKYSPDFDHSNVLEAVWWAIPIVIIGVLSVITWNSSHTLDPFRPVDANLKQLNVDVVALDWKWLFIYPDYGVASVNRLELPLNVPVDFHITSDTVMNSFWIPNLGGQIYAMPGMVTQLHLIASKPGIYYGSSANISGKGFAGMNFSAYASSKRSFKDWVGSLKNYPVQLNDAAYALLAKPSSYTPVAYYSHVNPELFSGIVYKYMYPSNSIKLSPMKGMN